MLITCFRRRNKIHHSGFKTNSGKNKNHLQHPLLVHHEKKNKTHGYFHSVCLFSQDNSGSGSRNPHLNTSKVSI